MYATCYCFVYYPLILLSLLFIAGHNCYGSESNGLHWFDTRHWPTHRANQNTEQRLCWQSENFPSWWFFIPFKIPCFYVCNLTVVHLQIYVEIERARLIKRLTKIKEEQGQIDEAADLMQELAVSLHCTRIEDMYFHIMWQCFCHSLVLFVGSGHPWLLLPSCLSGRNIWFHGQDRKNCFYSWPGIMAIYYVKNFVFLLKYWFMQNFLLLLSRSFKHFVSGDVLSYL